jgi:3-oxoacyl-[acyl-carrier protein] reductase
MIDPGLAGRTALITGTNNPEGIGAAIARAFGAQGARVFVTGFGAMAGSPPIDALSPGQDRYRALQCRPVTHLVEELRRRGAEADGSEWDLSIPEMVEPLLDMVENRLGPVSVLVNNAAHCVEDSFAPHVDLVQTAAISAAQHDRHFAVNSRAPALLMAEFARRHLEHGSTSGRVINISTDGASGHAGAVSYGASKHSLESYSRAAAWELGRYGITVNVVAPGPVQTGWISSEMEMALVSQIPLGRIGAPAEVADAVVFLASDQARWITGQVIYVGGGQVMPL